ncbi:peptidoglycan/xylan/chitin deacetylase (PgdA/CDA1 family) [Kribbella amoyensis]|uniref:Peptidoglycan/xylan/chitin deacetylase (PgdA/CDA1 family) n=1 Tax=Kribbella amoyensis TaxID=996641 RepID=A0A561B3A6_9ACTN|nr:polysaccharide deacetylase family protein [Kribbella amoyensis]TWD73343.1 peptidoglycan/xylan/chitin deacetylase (PgdA/CDA1 family) [Kribbella amoyensis]
MSRKLATVIGTVVAAALVVGGLATVALNHTRPPRPAVASQSTPAAPPTTAASSTPTTTPTRTPSGKPEQPVADPTASLAAGNKKVLFLSFDDGPDPVWTPRILQILRKHGAHATFFQLGRMQAEHPGLREQILADGHTIGSHSISHAQLTALPAAKRRHEIFDGPRSKCFRPPYGASNPKVRADIAAAGMSQVLWDVDPRDWKRPGVTAIVDNILHHAHRRNIILLHDGGGDRTQTAAALDKVLPLLKAQGYTFPAMTC